MKEPKREETARFDSEKLDSHEVDLQIANGLRFFSEGTPVTIRRRRFLFVFLWSAISASLIWPIYPLFASARPLIFGLPQSLVWVLVALVLMFSSLLWLFFIDERARARGQDKPGEGVAGTRQISGEGGTDG